MLSSPQNKMNQTSKGPEESIWRGNRPRGNVNKGLCWKIQDKWNTMTQIPCTKVDSKLKGSWSKFGSGKLWKAAVIFLKVILQFGMKLNPGFFTNIFSPYSWFGTKYFESDLLSKSNIFNFEFGIKLKVS